MYNDMIKAKMNRKGSTERLVTKKESKTNKNKLAFEAVDYEAYGYNDGQDVTGKKKAQKNLPLSVRLALEDNRGDKNAAVQRLGASRSTSYIPKSSKNSKLMNDGASKLQRGSSGRRSMKDIHK
jgi:hypothetical protein